MFHPGFTEFFSGCIVGQRLQWLMTDPYRTGWQTTFFILYSVPLYGCNQERSWDFPGVSVDKSPPANARDMGSIPGSRRFHVAWSNWASAAHLLCASAPAPTTEAHAPRACALQEACAPQLENIPNSLQLEKAQAQHEDPVQPKMK